VVHEGEQAAGAEVTDVALALELLIAGLQGLAGCGGGRTDRVFGLLKPGARVIKVSKQQANMNV
jgi:hypothetical protein